MAHCGCDDLPDGRRPPRRGMLAQAVEARTMKAREKEFARNEVENYYKEMKRKDDSAGNPLKEDIARKQREAKERAVESTMLDSMYQAERTRELALIRADEEEKLATALAKRIHDKDRSEKEVQHLREQSAELRELAERIRQAKVARERQLQLAEKAQIKGQQLEYDTALNRHVLDSAAAAAARDAEAADRRRQQAVQARHVLEEQIQDRQDMLRQSEIEAARERVMVDEIVKRIQEEDAANAAQRKHQVAETKAYIAQYLEDKTLHKAAQRAAEQAEDQRISEYWAGVRSREAEEAARAAERKEAADRLYEKIKGEMEAAQRFKDEEEHLINLLRQEEAEEKRRQEDEQRAQKAAEMRLEIQRANAYQMQLKGEREAQMRAEEEAFRQRMMAKFAEDDRIEQMNAQKRRMKQVEHQRQVQHLIDERRRMYAEAKARDEAEAAAQAAQEARKAGIIEEERRKLLREAAEYREFLPRGVIRDQADLDYINQHLAQLGRR